MTGSSTSSRLPTIKDLEKMQQLYSEGATPAGRLVDNKRRARAGENGVNKKGVGGGEERQRSQPGSARQHSASKSNQSSILVKSHLIAFLPLLTTCIHAFNFEPDLPIVHVGPRNSLFGLSLSTYKVNRDSAAASPNGYFESESRSAAAAAAPAAPRSAFDSAYVIVGAPNNSIGYSKEASQQNLPLAKNPGAIFACPIMRNSRCQPIELAYSNVAVRDERYKQITWAKPLNENSNATEQWLGASITTSVLPGGKIVACAPRWKQRYGIRGDSGEKESLAGQCWIMQHDPWQNKIVDVSGNGNDEYFRMPVYQSVNRETDFAIKRYRFQYAAFGTGIALSRDGSTYVMGAPAAQSYSGAVVMVNTSLSNTDYTRSELCGKSEYGSSNFRVCESMKDSTQAGYTGFALKIADKIPLRLDTGSKVIIAGAPNMYSTGGVIFMTRKANELRQVGVIRAKDLFAGDSREFTVGTSFGYSLEIADLNGDGFDDLIVGAPQYYDGERKGACVAVYLSNGNSHYLWDASKVQPILIHRDVDSFFGISITRLGDINGDGLDDVAIGAPYANTLWNKAATEGSGKVYIFYGDKNKGLVESQVIKPSDLPDIETKSTESGFSDDNMLNNREIKGFGFSVSSQGLDLDKNGYPDLAIGTLSDRIVVLRTRPLIKVKARVETVESVNLKTDKAEKKNVCLENGVWKHCVKAKICFDKTSDKSTKPVKFTAVVSLDKRLHYAGEQRKDLVIIKAKSAHNVTLSGATRCLPEQEFFLVKNPDDTLSALEIHVNLQYEDTMKTWPHGDSFRLLDDYPIVQTIDHVQKVALANECGPDQDCQSDLKLESVYLKTWDTDTQSCRPRYDDKIEIFVNGSQSSFDTRQDVIDNRCPRLVMAMKNQREDAHAASFKFYLPNGVTIISDEIELTLASKLMPTKSIHEYVVCRVVQVGRQIEGALDSDESLPTESEYTCTLKTPLKKNQRANIEIPIDFSSASRNEWADMKMTVRAVTASNQARFETKKKTISVILNVPVQFTVRKNFEQISINDDEPLVSRTSIQDVQKIGPQISYTLHVKNSGNMSLSSLNVAFRYPTKYDQAGEAKELLYLYETYESSSDTAKLSHKQAPTIDFSEDRSRLYPIVISKPQGPPQRTLVNPDGFKLRTRRQATDCARKQSGQDRSYVQTIGCNDILCPNECDKIYWKIPYLPANGFAEVTLEFYVARNTIIQEFKDVGVIKVDAEATLKVDNDFTKFVDAETISEGLKQNIRFEIDHQAGTLTEEEKGNKWLWIFLGILFGVLAYIILYCVLRHMGCFESKRSKSTSSAGHYQIQDLETVNRGQRKSLKKDADKFMQEMSDSKQNTLDRKRQTTQMVDVDQPRSSRTDEVFTE